MRVPTTVFPTGLVSLDVASGEITGSSVITVAVPINLASPQSSTKIFAKLTNHDIVWFQVAVNDSLAVCVGNRLANGTEDVEQVEPDLAAWGPDGGG